MLEGAGFDVIDLGINNPVENYLEALEKHKPDILGMSALVTDNNALHEGCCVDAMIENIRDDYIVLVGGAPLNEEFAEAVGADVAWSRDAVVAVETAKEMTGAAKLDREQAQPAKNHEPHHRRLLPAARLRRRIVAVFDQLPEDPVSLTCLPAAWHSNYPEKLSLASSVKWRRHDVRECRSRHFMGLWHWWNA